MASFLTTPEAESMRSAGIPVTTSESRNKDTDAKPINSESTEEMAVEQGAWYEDVDVLLTQFVALRNELDEVLDFKSERMSVMVARYPGGGAHYARHRDALPQHTGSRRRITAVYYLNPAWTAEQGGCLRTYFPPEVGKIVSGASPEGGASKLWKLDVEPFMDRLVLFSSEWLEHEVLPAYAERMAITMWLY